MRFLAAYKNSPEAKAALELAVEHARKYNAQLYVTTSQEGGEKEKSENVARIKQELNDIKKRLEQADIDFDVFEIVRGLSPGEDLVRFADENHIDHIFVGIEKKSRAQKIILGSTAQYIILKASCPVTTTK
ncbi:Universal stress family protein [Desulfonema limicola]|uniref:Universal stress family protein n=1 Tax=Desulfonema limicola TaxID=45656 RepID=A0A975GJE3_9BACT|nr:universal stress protein [Desulfonema limicola]QTA83370.1 Universal stress family protein [Desulfonema limicola]